MPSRILLRPSLYLKSSMGWRSGRLRPSMPSVIFCRACWWAFFGALFLCKWLSPLPLFCFLQARFSYFDFAADELICAKRKHTAYCLLMQGHRLRPLRYADPTVGLQLNCRCVKSEQFATPPQAVQSFFRHGCEPVLPENRAHVAGRPLAERISGKDREYVGGAGGEPSLGPQNPE